MTTPAAEGAASAQPVAAPAAGGLTFTTSRQFESWLAEVGASLALTTYQAGKLIFLGLGETGRLSIFERSIDRCMALHAQGDDLWVSSIWQLWRFRAVAGAPDGAYRGHDRLYAPRQSWVTGDLDIHDLDLDQAGRPVFANTLFSCIGTVSDTDSFIPLWQPRFITRLAPEDRCHLNGITLQDGSVAYATAVGACDAADGWRDHRAAGGVVIDGASGEVAATGLSMPHSPRLHEGRLWLVNAGTGELGVLDPASGRFEPVAFCPGFMRGLSFIGPWALVTLSLPRDNQSFRGLPLDDRLAAANVAARCGVMVIDTRNGAVAHWLRIEGAVTELFDVVALPGVRRPAAIGFRSDEVRRILSVGSANP